jgi:uncharacterized protein YcgI (DUF1989 family)
MTHLIESQLNTLNASYSCIIAPGEPWMRKISRGHKLRIIDVDGNQAADTLFYNATDTAESYSAQQTIAAQRGLYLTTGTQLVSSRGNVLLTITADT